MLFLRIETMLRFSTICLSVLAAGAVALGPAVAKKGAPSPAPRAVFKLELKDGKVANAWTRSTTVVDRPGPASALKAEFGGGKWNSYLVTPAGLLKGGHDYVVTVDYQVVGLPDTRDFFYLFARSDSLGNGPDKWVRWQGQPGQKGAARLSISLPQVDDFTVTAGVFGAGSIIVDGLTIEEARGWTRIAAVNGSRPKPGKGPNVGPLPTGPADFTIAPPAPAKELVVTMDRYPIEADIPDHIATAQEEERNHALFQAAIDECKNRHASRLVIPKGIYRVGSVYPLMFDGLADFTFDGQGSEFIFDRITAWHEPYMHLQNCKRCVFKNFTVDWDWDKDPIATVGRLIDIAADGSSFDMEFPNIKNDADLDRLQKIQWNYIFAIDPKTGAPLGRDHELGHLDPVKFEKLSPTSLRVWPNRPLPLAKGQTYVIRHHEYETDAFRLDGVENVTLDGVTVYSVPGIGYVVSNDTNHWQLLNCKIIPRPGANRPLSTAADGYHIQQSRGFMKLENCEFAFCGDDCLNLHDNCSMGLTRVGDTMILAHHVDRWRNPVHEGDLIEFRNADLSPFGFSSKITSVDYKNAGANQVRLTFADKLPANLPNDAVLFNRRYSASNMIIRHCSFHDNRGRGALLYISDSLVEGNNFARNQSSAVYVEIEITDQWSEGDGVANLIFRNNAFEEVNPKGTCDGAAIYVGAVLPHGSTSFPIFHDILFEGNQFINCPGPGALFSSCSSVIFRNNQFVDTSALPDPNPLRGTIRAELASGIKVADNVWNSGSYSSRAGLEFDPVTVKGLLAKGNVTVGGG